MPTVDDGSAPPKHDDERMWWNRGFDVRGSVLTCRLCGALVRRSDTYVTGRQYWQVHNAWHAAHEAGTAHRPRVDAADVDS